ncbi:hypothetical protein PM082_003876 [Marasmius tenuissimus]|nr:hypothetical protein PM082_003876 [Marasmius tenuissimus]
MTTSVSESTWSIGPALLALGSEFIAFYMLALYRLCLNSSRTLPSHATMRAQGRPADANGEKFRKGPLLRMWLEKRKCENLCKFPLGSTAFCPK